MEIEIETRRKEVVYWEEYRDRGQHLHDKTIQLLEQEMADLEASFAEISGRRRFNCSLVSVEAARDSFVLRVQYTLKSCQLKSSVYSSDLLTPGRTLISILSSVGGLVLRCERLVPFACLLRLRNIVTA